MSSYNLLYNDALEYLTLAADADAGSVDETYDLAAAQVCALLAIAEAIRGEKWGENE